VSGGRDRLVLVNSGFTGGDIEQVINSIAAPARLAGTQVEIISNPGDLSTICRNSLRGTSLCIAAAVFFSSPNERPGGKWNYSIRADGALGSKIVVDSDTNDVEIYALPLQHAIDFAIAGLNTSSGASPLPSEVQEYPYTSLTAEQRKDRTRVRFMGAIIDILAVAFFIGMVGTTYQLTGLIAAEREIGMAQLLDCMMPNRARWQPQMVRIISNHLAFDIIYAPGWFVMSIILSIGIFSRTSAGIVIIFHVLSGLSLSSMSIFGAAFFRKAQLSGITLVIVSLLLAIVSQVAAKASTGAVATLSLIFPPMNYVYFTILMARWERQNLGTNLLKAAPENPWTLPGIAFWIFLLVQIIVFPILGALVERTLYGTGSKSRTISQSAEATDAVTLNSFSKEFRPNWLRKHFGKMFGLQKDTVLAVSDLSVSAVKGQIMVLLGANGSGKSTTLDAIAGLTTISTGTIQLDFGQGAGGFGLCPQKNVLWDDLTVQEHVSIFNKIKCSEKADSKSDMKSLISACDVGHKLQARTITLSGGQKRKVQLAMMFTGGSSVCAVDEVSSGLDPISRRRIWDILLAERGTRSIILTTHFLDEADLLSDHIAILSKGSLKAEGTAVELKHRLGSGYRVHVYNLPDGKPVPEYPGIVSEKQYDKTIFILHDSAQAAEFVSQLENDGIKEYQVSGPTIEDVFLKVAEEVRSDSPDLVRAESPTTPDGKDGVIGISEKSVGAHVQTAPQLVSGRRIGMPQQAWVLFCKRATVLRRNRLPYLAALLIPMIATGLVSLFLKNFQRAGCSPSETISVSDISSLVSQINFDLVVGPADRLPPSALQMFASSLPGGGGESTPGNLTGLMDSIHMVDTLAEFNDYISNRFANVTPGGFFLGDASSPPTFAWRGNGDISFATITQNALDVLLTNISISSQYQAFDLPFGADVGKALQLIVYFGLAMAVYPSFFALYPTVERLRNVRALHYSNGVRSLPLWLAYVSFDFIIVVATSILTTIIFRAVSNVWYHLEYLFVVFFLYGLASTLLSYVISLFSRSQLAAFAFAAGSQAVMFLLYFIAYMSILTYSPTTKIDSHVNIAHFTIALISPAANLTRSLFIALNVFSLTCRDREIASYPGEITLYGGPILYLILQSFFLFGLLLWWDSGPLLRRLRKRFRSADAEDKPTAEAEVSNELTRVASSRDGLRVMNVTKQFKSNIAVDDVTFGVPRSEVFALLGPNGAGKSTIISLIRGDIQPSRQGGDIFVEDVSVAKNRAQARSHLGVCPQFDAMDTMTVLEHLNFYARIRGVPDPTQNVNEVMRAVGLQPYANRMAAKLSGGNKRKLSLGIALMGNPSVLLLDEPSSGMDAASKRVMWRTLASVVPGRSLVLTTHSMEEADALANRAGIMASRMLALGTTDYLRRKHGDAYHVHLVHKDAPHTSDAAMARIRDFVTAQFPAAAVEQKTWHGQMRFSVPMNTKARNESVVGEKQDTVTDGAIPSPSVSRGASISALFTLLEKNKKELGFEYYSVSQTTLDQVFLSIVGKHNVEGEDHLGTQRGGNDTVGRRKVWWGWLCYL
jgi:ATP-binding cassette, subfamily A (ABC1), member 3